MVQLSRLSSVVPVLTDTAGCPGIISSLEAPKAPLRALLSSRIWEIRKAVSCEMTRGPRIRMLEGISRSIFGSLNSSSTLPRVSSTLSIAVRSRRIPPLANTPNASLISSIVTSPPPSVRESPYRDGSVKVSMPNAEAEATMVSTLLR